MKKDKYVYVEPEGYMSKGMQEAFDKAIEAQKQEEKESIVYAEPADFFLKEIRKKYKLGEFCEGNGEEE